MTVHFMSLNVCSNLSGPSVTCYSLNTMILYCVPKHSWANFLRSLQTYAKCGLPSSITHGAKLILILVGKIFQSFKRHWFLYDCEESYQVGWVGGGENQDTEVPREHHNSSRPTYWQLARWASYKSNRPQTVTWLPPHYAVETKRGRIGLFFLIMVTKHQIFGLDVDWGSTLVSISAKISSITWSWLDESFFNPPRFSL